MPLLRLVDRGGLVVVFDLDAAFENRDSEFVLVFDGKNGAVGGDCIIFGMHGEGMFLIFLNSGEEIALMIDDFHVLRQQSRQRDTSGFIKVDDRSVIETEGESTVGVGDNNVIGGDEVGFFEFGFAVVDHEPGRTSEIGDACLKRGGR